MPDLISKKTRYEFREFFVSMTLRQIELEFDAADIVCDTEHTPSVSGQRRTLVEQYYHSVDWGTPADVGLGVGALFLNPASLPLGDDADC